MRLTAGEFRLVLGAMVLFMSGALVCVWSSVKTIKLAYESQILKEEEHRLLRENRLMQLEKESLRSLSRIQSLARTRLGLESPTNQQVVTIILK
jgi:cell division protein FtsL